MLSPPIVYRHDMGLCHICDEDLETHFFRRVPDNLRAGASATVPCGLPGPLEGVA